MRDDSAFSTFRAMTDSRRDLRHRRDEISIAGIGEVLEEHVSAIETHGQNYVNRMAAAKLGVQVSARSSKPGAMKSAQTTESFDFQFWHNFSDLPTDPFRRRLDQQTFYGIGILHPTFVPDVRQKLFRKTPKDVAEMLELLGTEEFTENPFTLECPSLGSTYWEKDFSVVCEIGSQNIAHYYDEAYEGDEDHKQFVNWLTSDTLAEDSEWSNKVQHYHLETAEWIYDVLEHPGGESVNAHMLEARPNVAGRPWYTFTVGHLTSDDEPHDQYVPIIHAVYAICQKINILETLVNSGALQTGRNMWQLVDIGSGVRDAIDILGDKNWQMQPEILIDPMTEQLQNPPDRKEWKVVPIPDQRQLIAALQEKKRELAEEGFPLGLSPGSPDQQGASSGYQAAIQVQQAITLLDPPLRNAAKAEKQLFELISDIIIGLKVPISLPVHISRDRSDVQQVTTLTPEDIKEVDRTVSYSSIPESAKITMDEANLRNVEAGTMSRETYMKLKYDDPLAEEKRIRQERLGVQVQQLADTDSIAIIQEVRGEVAQEVAAEEGLPLPPDPQRPPEGSVVPGLGAPAEPPPQSQPGQAGPSEVGLQQAVGAPQ